MKDLARAVLALMLTKLAQRSTWVGLAAFAATAGIYVAPEHAELIGTIGTLIAGAMLVKVNA
jgi:hypothetical protein